MAINKKLKKFNTNGDYRAFLGTGDFIRPDASSIGSSPLSTTITENPNHSYTEPYSKDDVFLNVPELDVEYNPEHLMFVNCKYYLSPSDQVIRPIIDTVTNGKIGCWWRYTTGNTWTKLNSTDLSFYSAYTQNKITNLTFNTVSPSTLKNNANIEYVLSAKSNTDLSVSGCDTDNCIQLGLIELDDASFDAAGETKSVQVRTAAGNKWEITNTNGWLSFSKLSGVGTTTLTVTASTNSDFDSRIGTVSINYIDVTYSSTATYTQNGQSRSFIWNENSQSALTVNKNWDETSISEGYTNNYTGLTVDGSVAWVTSRGITSTSSNGLFTGTTTQNNGSGASTRNQTFNIKSDGATVGTIKVVQTAKPASYLYVGNTLAEATTTACTYGSTVNSGAGSYTVYYKTNYTSAEIGTLTFELDSMFESTIL